jgi:hypothetical protein
MFSSARGEFIKKSKPARLGAPWIVSGMASRSRFVDGSKSLWP